jgi:transcriptional regulatory protein LevR
MDFTERLNLYQEGGMLSEEDVKQVLAVIRSFEERYGMILEEENADFFIAHLCAALGRCTQNEEIPPVCDEVMEEMRSLPTFSQSQEILHTVMKDAQLVLNETEQNYALLHINTMLAAGHNQPLS